MANGDSEYVKAAKLREAQQGSGPWFGCLGGLVLAGVMVYIFSGWQSSKSPCEDRAGAFVISQTFVKRTLRSPGSASFPSITSDGVSVTPMSLPDGRCAFDVRLYADAQNAFGATVRERFMVTVAPDGDDWSLISISPN